MDVAPNTLVVWSDLGCAWSHAVVWRLHDTRRRLGLDGRVAFDHRAFPLELFNNEPTPWETVSAEWPVAAQLAPRAGWREWSAPPETWPVTTLAPMEAVQAAKLQSLAASEELDRGLRRAFFGESRCISLRHVILEIATECDSLDESALAEALDAGSARRTLIDQWVAARGDEVRGSAHIFAPDGANAQNPGIEIAGELVDGRWTPRIMRDDPSAIDDLLRRAAGVSDGDAAD